jgi:hypothetical protein
MVAALSSLQYRNMKCVSPFGIGRMCILFMFNSWLRFPSGWKRLHWTFLTRKCNVCKSTNASGSTCMMHVFCTGKITKCLIFCWPCISSQIIVNNQSDALFLVFIYSLHLSTCFELQVLIIRRSNCINTSSCMISLFKWPLGMPVRRKLQFPPDRHTKWSLTQTNHTRWCINTIRSPDDDHLKLEMCREM